MLPPSDSRTPRVTRVSPMSRASGTERASRSSFGTRRVSPARTAARAHQFATDLIRARVDVVTVAELLGHASLDSTRIYTLPTEDDLDAAIAKLTIDRRPVQIDQHLAGWVSYSSTGPFIRVMQDHR